MSGREATFKTLLLTTVAFVLAGTTTARLLRTSAQGGMPNAPPGVLSFCACTADATYTELGDWPDCLTSFGMTWSGDDGECSDPWGCFYQRPCTGTISFTSSPSLDCTIFVKVSRPGTPPLYNNSPTSLSYSLNCGVEWLVEWSDPSAPGIPFAQHAFTCQNCE